MTKRLLRSTRRKFSMSLSTIAVLSLSIASTMANFDLVNLGGSSFTVDPGATTASYSQTSTNLIFNGNYALGDTLGGTFAPQNWTNYSAFGLKMTLKGANPQLAFTVQFYDSSFEVINTYQATTGALSLTPTVVMLDFSLPGTGNFSQVVGMQFTWDSDGAINTKLTDVVGFDAPATQGVFVARAPGGVRFLLSTNDVAGIELTPAGAWSSLSDSNAKTAVTSVDHREMLRKVSELPVTTWSYKHNPFRRHIGPMAQDFRTAFGLGFDEKHISTLDIDGVAISALKGLVEELRIRKERSTEQARRLEGLHRELLELQRQVDNHLPPAP